MSPAVLCPHRLTPSLSALSMSFWQFLSSRFVVGIGSSGITVLQLITINGANSFSEGRPIEADSFSRDRWSKTIGALGKSHHLYRDDDQYGSRPTGSVGFQAVFLALVRPALYSTQ